MEIFLIVIEELINQFYFTYSRNCIEIINKLVETGLLNIIFTSDGKEYVTPKHLQRYILTKKLLYFYVLPNLK